MGELNEYGLTPWRFESTVTDPSGIRTTVTVTVPLRVAWGDIHDCGEVAQMGASQTAARVAKNRTEFNEECPF